MMNFIAIGGFLVSIIGTVLAVVALYQAGSAKRAVDQVLEKSNEQVARDNSRDLLNKLKAAKEAALARRGSSSNKSVSGRNIRKDIDALKQAQDGLATIIISSDSALENSLRLASNELNNAIDEVHHPVRGDGWAHALSTLQAVTTRLNTYQIRLGTTSLKI